MVEIQKTPVSLLLRSFARAEWQTLSLPIPIRT